jgi:hypothetical protein
MKKNGVTVNYCNTLIQIRIRDDFKTRGKFAYWVLQVIEYNGSGPLFIQVDVALVRIACKST